jgi:hypothetical protein
MGRDYDTDGYGNIIPPGGTDGYGNPLPTGGIDAHGRPKSALGTDGYGNNILPPGENVCGMPINNYPQPHRMAKSLPKELKQEDILCPNCGVSANTMGNLPEEEGEFVEKSCLRSCEKEYVIIRWGEFLYTDHSNWGGEYSPPENVVAWREYSKSKDKS